MTPNTLLAGLLVGALALSARAQETSPYAYAIDTATSALERGETTTALPWIRRALERDPKAIEAWDLRARWAEATEDEDELVYTLHKMLGLAIAQKAKKSEIRALRERLLEADPIAPDLLSMKESFLEDLLELATSYEKEKRPHSAIAIYREAIAVDPENEGAAAAIERIASQPDPSLAGDAKGQDLFADVTEQWIRKHDEKHASWGKKGSFKSDYYNVNTNAGYRILIQSATAMDQMHVFYKRFFGVTGSVARIDLNIFATRDEYLKLGQSPSEWSGGQFTGGSVETFVGSGGFQATLNVLFHEAAHQFVNRATSAGGWLNEGLASFFEGSELLPNGTVRMNAPAAHRLGALAARLDVGWMNDYKDGTDQNEPNMVPPTSPTFDIVLENKYVWGPAWYAPTWGVVYFCYNYQDPADGRFVYRKAFLEYLDKSGGRSGESAITNFEEIVLESPTKPTKGVTPEALLPETVAELNPIWKAYILRLRDEQNGTVRVERPYHQWAQFAVKRKELDVAAEHFEQGLLETPRDPDLLFDFAKLLAEDLRNEDRGVKLALRALEVLEAADDPDEKRIASIEKQLGKWDDNRRSLNDLHRELWAASQSLVRRYLTSERYMMTMDLAWRLTSELRVPGLTELYDEAWRRSKKSLHLWKLAYNEQNLEGWSTGPGTPFEPKAEILLASNGKYREDDYAFSTLPMDFVTSGDFSIQVDVQADPGDVTFCGIVFGMRGGATFNSALFLPGKGQTTGIVARSAYVDLSGFRGGSLPIVWRHVPIVDQVEQGQSTAGGEWKRLRLDVTGPFADVYVNGELKVVHEYPSARMAAGSIGLIVGRGSARFRNVRYLARAPRDPGARLEREIKMEAFADADTSVGGSWLGKVPPFPKVQKWLANERASWKEAGPVPQLLAMWSIRQNDLIQINDWLAWLEERYRDVGLQVVCVGSVEDTAAIEKYLERRPFPGSVALDGSSAELGDTFDKYAIEQFNLPRLILLDIDGKVVWEGDPGFRASARWTPGTPTFIDAPIEELLDRRNLRELSGWRGEWNKIALPALHDADLLRAKPVLQAAARFKARGDADVFDAQSRLSSVENAVAALEVTVASLQREGCEPAVDTLLDWARIIDFELDRTASRSVKALAASATSKEWEGVLKHLNSHKRRVKRDGAEQAQADLRAFLATKSGRFPAILSEQVGAVAPDEVLSMLDAAERIPELWLARDYFNW